MVHQATRFTDAYSAWETWNLTDFDARSDAVISFNSALKQGNATLANVAGFHIEHASNLLSEVHDLVGPTGETNELYTAGRGVALIVHDTSGEQSQYAVIAQLTASVLAGNSVILCSDDNELSDIIHNALQESAVPANLVQCASLEAYQQLLESDIRCLGYIGSQDVERRLNRELAKRPGAIVALTSETDLTALPVANDPYLSLRFITERTRTINITAVGGNATLLELGSEPH